MCVHVCVCVVVGCNPIPTASPTGDVTPGQRIAKPEIETTALGGIAARARCGLPAGQSEIFISGGNNFMIRTSTAALGVTASISYLPDPSDVGMCLSYPFQVYTAYTDHNLARLPDGRVVNVNLYSKHGATPDTFCGTDIYPEIERALVVRVSDDCGASWSVRNVIDATSISGLGPLTYHFIDRQTLFVDTEQEMMYLAFRVAEETPSGNGHNHTVVLGAPTTFATTPVWNTVAQFASGAGPTVLTADPHDGLEWLYLFQCDVTTGAPTIGLIPTPTRYQADAAVLPVVLDEVPLCRWVDRPITTAQLVNRTPQPNIVPMGGSSFRLVYPGVVVTKDVLYQTAHIVDFQLDYNYLFFGRDINVETLDDSAEGRHVLFADLVWPEGFENLSTHSGQQVLSWIEVSDASLLYGLEPQRTRIRAWRPDTQSWWDFGVVAQSILDGYTLDRVTPRFFGDYRLGTFIDESNGAARYFAPWVQTLPGAATPNAQIFGELVAQ